MSDRPSAGRGGPGRSRGGSRGRGKAPGGGSVSGQNPPSAPFKEPVFHGPVAGAPRGEHGEGYSENVTGIKKGMKNMDALASRFVRTDRNAYSLIYGGRYDLTVGGPAEMLRQRQRMIALVGEESAENIKDITKTEEFKAEIDDLTEKLKHLKTELQDPRLQDQDYLRKLIDTKTLPEAVELLEGFSQLGLGYAITQEKINNIQADATYWKKRTLDAETKHNAEIEALSDELATLKSEQSKSNAEKDDAVAKAPHQEETIKRLKAALEEAKTKNNAYSSEVDTQRVTISNQFYQIQGLLAAKEELTANNVRLDERITQFTTRIGKQVDELKTSQAASSEGDKQISQLSTTVELLLENTKSHDRQLLAESQSRLTAAEKSIRDKDGQLKDLHSQLSKLKADNDALIQTQAQHGELTAKLEKWGRHVRRYRDQRNELRDDLDNASERIEVLGEKLSAATDRANEQEQLRIAADISATSSQQLMETASKDADNWRDLCVKALVRQTKRSRIFATEISGLKAVVDQQAKAMGRLQSDAATGLAGMRSSNLRLCEELFHTVNDLKRGLGGSAQALVDQLGHLQLHIKGQGDTLKDMENKISTEITSQSNQLQTGMTAIATALEDSVSGFRNHFDGRIDAMQQASVTQMNTLGNKLDHQGIVATKLAADVIASNKDIKSTIEGQLKDQRASIVRLERENERLENYAAILEQQTTERQTELDNCKQDHSGLQKRFDAKAAELTKAVKDRDAALNERLMANLRTAQVEQDLEALKLTLNLEAKKQVDEWSAALARRDQAEANYRDTLKQLRAEKDRVDSDLALEKQSMKMMEETTLKIAAEKDEANDNTRKIADELALEKEEAKEKDVALTQANRTLEARLQQIERLDGQITGLQEEVARSKQEYDNSVNQRRAIESQVNALKDTIANLEEAAADQATKEAELQSELDDAQRSVDDYSKAVKKLQSDVAYANNANSEHAARLVQLMRDSGSTTDQLRNEVKELSSQLESEQYNRQQAEDALDVVNNDLAESQLALQQVAEQRSAAMQQTKNEYARYQDLLAKARRNSLETCEILDMIDDFLGLTRKPVEHERYVLNKSYLNYLSSLNKPLEARLAKARDDAEALPWVEHELALEKRKTNMLNLIKASYRYKCDMLRDTKAQLKDCEELIADCRSRYNSLMDCFDAEKAQVTELSQTLAYIMPIIKELNQTGVKELANRFTDLFARLDQTAQTGQTS